MPPPVRCAAAGLQFGGARRSPTQARSPTDTTSTTLILPPTDPIDSPNSCLLPAHAFGMQHHDIPGGGWWKVSAMRAKSLQVACPNVFTDVRAHSPVRVYRDLSTTVMEVGPISDAGAYGVGRMGSKAHRNHCYFYDFRRSAHASLPTTRHTAAVESRSMEP